MTVGLLGALALFGASASVHADAQADRAAWKEQFRRPAEIPFPESNPYSDAKAKLGRTLFFDPILSGSKARSCATCHNPGLSWADGQPRAVGEYGPLHLPALGRRRPQPELRRVVPHDPLDRKAQQPAERLVDKHDQPVAGPHHHHPVRRPVEQALQEPLNALGHQQITSARSGLARRR